jgi:hypothetical protein
MARKPSAHAELDELRQAAARSAGARLEAEVGVAGAQAALGRLENELGEAYYRDQSSEAAKPRKSRSDLEAAVEDTELRLAAARRRDEGARAAVDAFQTERARDVLAESAPVGERLARELTETLERAVSL